MKTSVKIVNPYKILLSKYSMKFNTFQNIKIIAHGNLDCMLKDSLYVYEVSVVFIYLMYYVFYSNRISTYHTIMNKGISRCILIKKRLEDATIASFVFTLLTMTDVRVTEAGRQAGRQAGRHCEILYWKTRRRAEYEDITLSCKTLSPSQNSNEFNCQLARSMLQMGSRCQLARSMLQSGVQVSISAFHDTEWGTSVN